MNFSDSSININPDIEFRPPYPLRITVQELLEEKKNKFSKFPNNFVIYRNELLKELKSRKITKPRAEVSALASRLWNIEPDYVKNAYKKISREGGLLYKQLQQEAAFTTSSYSSLSSSLSSSVTFPADGIVFDEKVLALSPTLSQQCIPILNSSDFTPDDMTNQILEQQSLYDRFVGL